MKRLIFVILMAMAYVMTQAQKVNHNFQNVTMPEALHYLNKATNRYTINFIYDDLEDFRVTTRVENLNVPDAIRKIACFYPISISFPSDSLISVECSQKANTRYKGRIIDENNQSAEYANIALLSTQDSSIIANGVSNESGYFVIPCEAKSVILKVSYVGYKTLFRTISNSNIGVIQLTPDKYTVQGVTVKGHKTIMKSTADRLMYLVDADEFAKGLNGQELLKRVPMLDGKGEGLASIIGKSNTHYLINGREIPEGMQLSKIRSYKSEEIERIEVITIPPSKYKAETNAGYVNIVLKKDQTLGLKGTAFGLLSYHDKWDETADLNLNYATKRLSLSWQGDLWQVDNINDHSTEFEFSDHKRATDFHTNFKLFIPSTNIVAQYKLTDNINIGATGSLNTHRLNSNQVGTTTDAGKIYNSINDSPAQPNFNINAETYLEWQIDSTGKAMNLTYDYLNNYSKQDGTIFTESEDATVGIHTSGDARYRIDSWKLDFTLPFKSIFVETGLAYTYIYNNSGVKNQDKAGNNWITNLGQSFNYQYKEKTAAAYLSMSKNWSRVSINGGVRLEQTWNDGLLINNNETHSDNYHHIFPTLHLNWQVASRSSLGLAYSSGIRRPDFLDLNPYRYYYTANSYFVGDPYLKPSLTNNFEISFNNSIGLYAVAYENHTKNEVGTHTTFASNGDEVTAIANSITSDKAGVYVSFQKTILPWWNFMAGADGFYYHSSPTEGHNDLLTVSEWSGKLETTQTMFLNKAHTLACELSYTHMFPFSTSGQHYKTVAYFTGNIRYSCLDDRLKFSLSFDDPFHQNISRSSTKYDTYTMNYYTDAHSRSITLSVTYSFGGKEVRGIYHQNKNTESSRANMR